MKFFLPKIVTFTGADDSVQAEEIIALAKKYPSTEWGILFGGPNSGASRFPSRLWVIKNIPKLAEAGLNLCAHLCGGPVYDLVQRGDFTWLYYYDEDITGAFQRVQINFHGQRGYKPVNWLFDRLNATPYQFIFQDDEVNGHIAGHLGGDKRVRLFDVSHGAGVLPENPWPKREATEYMGYAGGLGPDNIKEQLPLISKASGGKQYGPYWIDMETRVRSNRDKQFDLEKCEQVCKVVWG